MTLPAPDEGIGDAERARRLAIALEQAETQHAREAERTRTETDQSAA